MNATHFRWALLPALFAGLGGCASSGWERTEAVDGGRLYVPRVYAPLLPGSIYPDRRTPSPAKNRPAVVVVCPEAGECREKEFLDQAAQRGFIVLVGREPKDALLRTRAEADPARIGWIFVAPTGNFLRRWIQAGASGEAAAVIGLPRHPSAPDPLPSSLSQKILLAALLADAPLEAKDGTILKLYSPNKQGLLPNEAFRDAVEWLAGELEAR